MKKLFFALMFLGGVVALGSCSKDGPTTDDPRPETTVPFSDAKFRAKLIKLGFVETNGSIDPNSAINKALFASMTSLDLSSMEIASLKGIEFFTALTHLYCFNNQLTALDPSKNTALNILDCSGNQLTALDPSKNTVLIQFSCSGNQLTALDISKNTALTELYCYENQLSRLDLSKNTALTELYCHENQLSRLDLSKNTALTRLYCSDNQLSTLDLSKNAALTRLYCNDNQLSTLDLSKNAALTILACQKNQLATLDITKIIGPLQYLLCGDQQPDKTLSLTLSTKQDTEWTLQNESGNARITKVIYNTPVPDAKFRAELIKLGFVETNSEIDPNNVTNKALFASTTELALTNKQIATLDGIEYFTALTTLYCQTNRLTTLDLSKNTALTELDCYNNQLPTLDLSKNTALTRLDCWSNQLTTLDLSENTALTYLDCYYNQLSTLDISKIINPLQFLSCGGQFPNKTLTLTLTAAQDASWTTQGDGRNAHIIKVIK